MENFGLSSEHYYADCFDFEKKCIFGSVFTNCDDLCCRMSFEDFCRYFTSIDICHMINTSLISLSKTWKEYIVEGEWKRNRCGGCANNRTFLENPQVRSTMIRTLLTYWIWLNSELMTCLPKCKSFIVE